MAQHLYDIGLGVAARLFRLVLDLSLKTWWCPNVWYIFSDWLWWLWDLEFLVEINRAFNNDIHNGVGYRIGFRLQLRSASAIMELKNGEKITPHFLCVQWPFLAAEHQTSLQVTSVLWKYRNGDALYLLVTKCVRQGAVDADNLSWNLPVACAAAPSSIVNVQPCCIFVLAFHYYNSQSFTIFFLLVKATGTISKGSAFSIRISLPHKFLSKTQEFLVYWSIELLIYTTIPHQVWWHPHFANQPSFVFFHLSKQHGNTISTSRNLSLLSELAVINASSRSWQARDPVIIRRESRRQLSSEGQPFIIGFSVPVEPLRVTASR